MVQPGSSEVTAAAGEAPIRRGTAPRILLALVAIVGIGALVSTDPKQLLSHVASDRAAAEALIGQWGVLSGVAFIFLYACLMTLLWIPAWPCTVTSGFLFGQWLGSGYALIGATLGAVAVFLLARNGFGGLARRGGAFVRRLEAGFRADAFSYILALRLMPVAPFAIVNIVPAMLGVRLPVFALATSIGIVPSTLIYAGLGVDLAMLVQSRSLGPGVLLRPAILLPLVGLAMLALVPVAYRWLWRKRDR